MQAGATSCTECPAGQECPSTNTPGTSCSSGYYSLGGQSSCTACPAGYKCPNNVSYS